MTPAPESCFEAARRYAAAGISIVPIRVDGSKAAAVGWKPYQERLPTEVELQTWFRGNVGLAMIGGAVSGNLFTLDIDRGAFLRIWFEHVKEYAPDLAERIHLEFPTVQTPSGGYHVRWRCMAPIEGNQVLAYDLIDIPEDAEWIDDGKSVKFGGKQYPVADNDAGRRAVTVAIETRAEGGYAIVPPSPAGCHPSGKRYKLLRGDLAAPPRLTPDEHNLLIGCAHMANRYVAPERVIDAPRPRAAATAGIGGRKPGEDYNERGDALSVLQQHGWRLSGTSGEKYLLMRPGKGGGGWSATWNHGGSRLLTVFSSNGLPFEQCENKADGGSGPHYSPFAVYAMLDHGGDFSAAARDLYQQGYGDRFQEPERDANRCFSPDPQEPVAPADLEEMPSAPDLDDEDDPDPQADPAPQSAAEAPDSSSVVDLALSGLLPDIVYLFLKLPVEIHARGLRVKPEATSKERARIFECVMNLSGDTAFWFNFGIADAYNAMPGDHGSKTQFSQKRWPGRYQRARQLAMIGRRWPEPLRQTSVWSFYEVTGAIKDARRREPFLQRWLDGEFPSIQALREEVKLVTAAEKERSERNKAGRDPEPGPAPAFAGLDFPPEARRAIDALLPLIGWEGIVACLKEHGADYASSSAGQEQKSDLVSDLEEKRFNEKTTLFEIGFVQTSEQMEEETSPNSSEEMQGYFAQTSELLQAPVCSDIDTVKTICMSATRQAVGGVRNDLAPDQERSDPWPAAAIMAPECAIPGCPHPARYPYPPETPQYCVCHVAEWQRWERARVACSLEEALRPEPACPQARGP